MKRKTSEKELAKLLGISNARSLEAVMKAQLISAILAVIHEKQFTHAKVAAMSGLPRSAVTGILSGSLQKVTIDRLLKLTESVGLSAHLVIKKAA